MVRSADKGKLQKKDNGGKDSAKAIQDRREHNLINVRKHLEKLAGKISEAVWICTPDWKHLEYAGPGFESVWGIGAAELKKDPLVWLDRVDAGDRSCVRRAVKNFDPRCAVEMSLPSFRIDWHRSGGRLVTICLFAIDWEDGSPRVAMVCRDVTELEYLQRSSKGMDQRYRELFDQVNDAIFIHDMQGRILEVNATAAERLGYNREELLDMTVAEFALPENRKRLKSRLEILKRDGRLVMDSVHVARDGRMLDVEVNAKLIDYHGTPATLSVVRDITERKLGESRINAQNEMIQAVFDNIPVMIVHHNTEAQQYNVNQEFTRQLGWTNDDASAGDLLKLCFPDPEYRHKAIKYMEEDSIHWIDFELTAKDGSVNHSSWSNVALSDGTSIGIGIDIEDRLAEERAIETLVESTAGSTGQRLFDKVTANLCKWLGMDAAIIGLFESDYVRGVSMVIAEEVQHNVLIKLSDLPCKDLLDKGFVHIESDVYKMYRNQAMYQKIKAQGYIGILLKDKNGVPVGALATVSRRKLPLTPRIEKIVRVIAARIAAELDRIKSDEALAYESRANKALADLARKLIRMEDIEQISRLVLDHALLLTDSSQGFTGYIDPKNGKLICPRLVTAGRRKRKAEPNRHELGKPRGLWGWVMENRQPLMVNDTASDSRYGRTRGGDPIGRRRFFGVPAQIGDDILGVLAVADADWDYAERDGYVLERLSALYAIAIRRNRDQAELLKLSEAVAQSPNSIVISDPTGTIEFVNPRFCETSGAASSELLGKNLRQLQSEEEQRETYDDLWKSVGKGKVWKGELLSRGQDGLEHWDLVSIAPVKNAKGEIAHFIEIKEDISLRKKAEQALQAARDELEERVLERTESLEKANINLRGEIDRRRKSEQALSVEQRKLEVMLRHERVVAEAAESFNSSALFSDNLHSMLARLGDALGLDSVTVWEIDNRAGIARFFHNWQKEKDRKCIANGDFCRKDLPGFFDRISRGEPVISQPGGNGDGLGGFFKHCGHCLSLSSPLSVAGKVKGMIDFRKHGDTTWTEEEIKLLRSLSEIVTNAWERYNEVQARLAAERRQTESVQMVERATRLASIGVIAAGITHEINQPLNAIRLTADGSLLWLERNELDLPEKFTDRLKKISSHVERITKIIRHMRQFWAPRKGVESELFDLRDAVSDAVGLIDTQLASHGIRLVKAFSEEPITLSGDRLHLEQIVINLAVNSMQILDANKRDDAAIEIRTSLRGDEGVLEVEDNGPGFQIDDIEKIFEMFYTTRKPGEGSGLGLAIVKRYSEELGGQVVASNRSGKGGALFTVTLPLAGERVQQA